MKNTWRKNKDDKLPRPFAPYQLDAGDILGLVVVGNASSYRVRASETEQLAEATPVCYLSVWIC